MLILLETPLLAFRLIGVAALALLIATPILAIVLKRRGEKRLADILNGFNSTDSSTEPTVNVRFHTYHGFLIFVIQHEHVVALPADAAQRFLLLLHKFNMSWGCFAYGALIIPLLSWINYKSQLRSIRNQVQHARHGRA